MADPYDFGTGLVQAISRGVGAYADASTKRDLLNAEMASKGLIAKDGKWVKDPAMEAQERRKRQQEAKLKAALEGQNLEFDDLSGEISSMSYRPDYLQMKKELAEIDAQKDPYGSKRLAAEMAQARLEEMQTGKREKELALETPYGMAKTPDDASKVKDAGQARQQFDQIITDMIDLRKKYGGEMLNRSAVMRGKQLADNALLALKKLEQLGVLSQSDIDIARNVIPADPLQFSFSKMIGGKDPILSTLESAKSDAAKKFEAQVSGRLRTGLLPKSDAAPRMNPEDVQALEWANQNPNDPRAIAIKQSLGGM